MKANLFKILAAFLTIGPIKAQMVADRADQTVSAITFGRDNLKLDFSLKTGINHRMHYISIGLSRATLNEK